ncbi:glycosyltransferase family 2 protein [Microscilla marina]|uniref:Putative glycosyl transferase n=1 Tax=Microscilla marina ATCC 23134 TaxID=313606 RepID=A1ZLY4_MICM2|nr:glycosyltransferase family 2 protein [Microscilla marina]EAY28516.1 putative glycosyl transferase [Microscilla marina ATCC 23134]
MHTDSTQILVSVVMPVYNAAPYLKDSIDSILHQTYPHFEFIIVNDASQDESQDIITSYNDPRICLINKPTNTGIADAINQGLAVAKGKYIVRMDADDKSVIHRIATQVKFMEDNPHIGVSGAFIHQFKTVKGKDQWVKVYNYPSEPEVCRLRIFTRRTFTYHPTVIIRHQLLQEHQLKYDPTKDPAEDANLWHRMTPFCQFGNIPEVLVHYRLHDQQTSTILNHLLVENYTISFRQLMQTIYPDITEEEFQLHCDFFSQRALQTYPQAKFQTTLDWLQKLISTNRELNEYICPQDLLLEDIAKKWFAFCNQYTTQGFSTWRLYKKAFFRKYYNAGKKNTLRFLLDCILAKKSHYLEPAQS